MRPHHEHSTQFGPLTKKKDIVALKAAIMIFFTRLMPKMRGFVLSRKLDSLDLYSLEF